MLKEVFTTARNTREIEILSRGEQVEIVEFVEAYFKNANRALLTIHGNPGSGKSFLVKNVIESVKFNERTRNATEALCIYLDISDCVDQAEVYYRIALQLLNYYEENGKEYKENREKANLLILLYEWFQGVSRSGNGKKSENVATASDIAAFITGQIKKILDSKHENKAVDDVLESILSTMVGRLPMISTMIRAVDLIRNVRKDEKWKKFHKLIKNRLELLSNHLWRQNYFLELLKIALPNNDKKYMIVLDNFQLNHNNELGRDYTWLTDSNKLMMEINALWVVVSRMSANELFEALFDENQKKDVKILGFDKELAGRYLIKNCFPEENPKFFYLGEEEELCKKKELVEAMLNAVRLSAEETEGEYLPYLLRLIVLYYWKLKDTPALNVTPDMFIELEQTEEFVGYYFYKDLSDLMINAFQILSCIDVWDDVWINVVQQRMDNHLLNARNLLVHTAPMEIVELNGFKLHEALREALYRNKQNYIKNDVLEHLFHSFITIYERNLEKDKSVWYDLKRIQTFMEIIFAYVDLSEEKAKERLKQIRVSMENIYSANKERGTVSEAFIRLYGFYVDKLQNVYGIPFIKMVGNTFENVTWELVEDRSSEEEKIYYMECCFKLADLYTNKSQNGIAERLEKLCITFWIKQMEEAQRSSSGTYTSWYYRCWQQKIKALNATAYDCSAEKNYVDAYSMGIQGEKEAQELCKCLFAIIIPESVERFSILYNSEILEQVVKENDDIEIPHELYEELIELYTKIWEMKDSSKNIERVLWEILMKDYQKLRGNIPWYILNNLDNELIDFVDKKMKREDCIRYGICTYWMRRCMYDALQETELKNDKRTNLEFKRRMLKSYHNICVYLEKNEEFEKACLIGVEVLEESIRIMEITNPNENAKYFLQETEKEKREPLQQYLWQMEGMNDEETGLEFFSKPDNIVEQMQYLGDFYLNMKRYTPALKWLSKVMLFRTVSLGATDSKTLDTVMRFYVTSFAKQKEYPELFELVSLYVKEHYLELSEETRSVFANNESKGKQEKYMQIEKIVQIGKSYNDIRSAVLQMLVVL